MRPHARHLHRLVLQDELGVHLAGEDGMHDAQIAVIPHIHLDDIGRQGRIGAHGHRGREILAERGVREKHDVETLLFHKLRQRLGVTLGRVFFVRGIVDLAHVDAVRGPVARRRVEARTHQDTSQLSSRLFRQCTARGENLERGLAQGALTDFADDQDLLAHRQITFASLRSICTSCRAASRASPSMNLHSPRSGSVMTLV